MNNLVEKFEKLTVLTINKKVEGLDEVLSPEALLQWNVLCAFYEAEGPNAWFEVLLSVDRKLLKEYYELLENIETQREAKATMLLLKIVLHE